MCTPRLFAPLPTDGKSDSFSPSILPSTKNLFILGDFNCNHPLWDSRVTTDPHREEVFNWVIFSDLLPSMILTHPPFSIAPLAVTPLLASPLLPLFLPFLAPGRCSRTLVLTIYQFFLLSLFLRSFASTSFSLPSIFRKLAGMALLPTLTLTVPQHRNTRLFPLLLLSLLL